MKKMLSIIVLCLMAQHVLQAAVVAQDDFEVDGPLNGQSGGTGFRDAWSGGEYRISNGVVSGAGEAFRTLEAPLASSGTLWVSFRYGVDVDQEDYGGLSFFEGTTERLIIGDTFGQDVWGMDSKRSKNSKVHSSISTLGMKTCVAKITLGAGSSSRVDLWVGTSADSQVDISRTPDLSMDGVSLSGVDRLRIGAELNTKFGGLILKDSPEEVSPPTTLGLIIAFYGALPSCPGEGRLADPSTQFMRTMLVS
jgi:hypothetical protein